MSTDLCETLSEAFSRVTLVTSNDRSSTTLLAAMLHHAHCDWYLYGSFLKFNDPVSFKASPVVFETATDTIATQSASWSGGLH